MDGRESKRVGDLGLGGPLTDAQYTLFAQFSPQAKSGDQPEQADRRRTLEGILHVGQTGLQWGQMPPQYSPWHRRAYDAGKLIRGRKRRILVDTFGFLLASVVHAASIHDKPGAVLLLQRCSKSFSRIQVIFAEGGYDGDTVRAACKDHDGSRLDVIRRSELSGFQMLPKRWIVERSFAWLGRNRRLSNDYEQLEAKIRAFVMLAMLRLIAARIA